MLDNIILHSETIWVSAVANRHIKSFIYFIDREKEKKASSGVVLWH